LPKYNAGSGDNRPRFKLPGGKNNTPAVWRDYPLVYKGTLGDKGTISKLPSSPTENDAYKLLQDGCAKGYVNVGGEWKNQSGLKD